MSVLILTHPDDVHAHAVSEHLANAGVETHRLDTADLGNPNCPVNATIAGGVLTGQFGRCDLDTVTCVWHRRPTNPDGSFDDVAEIRAGIGGLLACLPHLNHPADMAMALKPLQLVIAGKQGLRVPESLISSQTEAAQAFAARVGNSVVVKPVSRENMPGRMVTDFGREGWSRALHLTQQRIVKDYDVRITVVDHLLFAAKISSPYLDYRVDTDSASIDRVIVPTMINLALGCWMREFHLRFCTFDFAVDGRGQWWFLEGNPNGQWLWIEDATGLPIAKAVAHALSDVVTADQPYE